MRVQQINEHIYRVMLAWGNAYVLKENDRVALIDTGLQKDRDDLLCALQEIGVEAQQVSAVFLTHGHTDHAGNAALFAKQGAKLYAHTLEIPHLRLPPLSYSYDMQVRHRPFTSLAFTIGERRFPVERYPDIERVEEGSLIDAPGGSLHVIATHGHSPGHVSYWYQPHDILFSGDAILTIVPIRLKQELSLPMRLFSTNWAQAIQSAKYLSRTTPAMMLPGHGNPLTEDVPERLEKWGEML